MTHGRKREWNSETARNNISGIFKGLGDIMDRLSELGSELSKNLEFAGQAGEKRRPFQGVYGFSIKVGSGGDGVKVEPFGHVQKRAGAEAEVHEVREPMIDTFQDGEDFHLIAEMPGIGEKDLRIDIQEDILTLTAEAGDKRYRKEVLLPRPYKRQDSTIFCNNGIVDIKLRRSGARDES